MLGLGRLFSSFRDLYKELNPATLTGAVDVIVLELSDGSFVCSPFYVRFGKMGVLRSREKLVDISINDEVVSLHMKLAESGEAYFVEDTFEEHELPLHLATSPIPTNGAQLMADGLADLKRQAAAHSDCEIPEEDGVSATLSSPIVSPASGSPTFFLDPEKTPTVENSQLLSVENAFHQIGAKSFGVQQQLSVDRRQQKKMTRLRRENELSRQRAIHSRSFSWHGGSLPNLAMSSHQQQQPAPNSKTPDPQIQRVPADPSPRNFRLSKSFVAHHQLELEFPECWNEINANGEGSNSVQLTPVPPENGEIVIEEEASTNKSNVGQVDEMALSLCGGVENASVTDESFKLKEVSYDQLNANPELLSSRDLVVRIDNRYYKYQVAAPILLSLLVFRRPLTDATVDSLIARYHSSVQNSDEQMPNGPLKEPKLDGLRQSNRPVSTSSYYSSWFSWRRAASMEPNGVSKTVDNKIVDASTDNRNVERPSVSALSLTSEKEDELSIEMMSDEMKDVHDMSIGFDDRGALSDSELDQTFERPTTSSRYRKTLYLTSDQLKTLKLKPNQANRAIFSVTTKYQGTSACECEIFLWRWHDKIVISDVDGTITKSDVLGHIMPIVGRQWEHSNVADLFTRIADNGYRVMYLTARAIGQSHWTKDYLKSIKQDNRALPDGPLQLSPTSLFNAFHSEVIEKKPEIFKTKCLRDIKVLFPETASPFYAGFGNKSTDEIAYRAAGVPSNRIFTINPTGEVRFADKELRSSYQHISDLVDHIFPPLPMFKKTNDDQLRTTSAAPTLAISATSVNPLEEYTNFSYWRQPFSAVPVDVTKFSAATDKTQKPTRKDSISTTKKK